MRSLEDARSSWQELRQYKSLRQLKDAVRLSDGHSSIATRGLRSACWKAFLLFDSLDFDEWQRVLASSRSAYNSLRAHFFRFMDNLDDADPLSQDTETSAWQQRRKDEDLRAEILQDVERCMFDFTREADNQRMLLDVLFTFCKLNPDIGYRQGMHEIAAYVLFVMQNDAVEIDNSSKAFHEDHVIKTFFDCEHVEHDSFAVFGQVMQCAKTFYLSEGITVRSRHIFEELLPQVDKVLMVHLQSLDVLPQVFLIRWIRLLFGREFAFDSVLALWDVIFAEDTSLEIVNHICLTMLLRIRWHLLEADYNSALGLLLRYPELDQGFPAQTLGIDALYLKAHMHSDGGSYCVLKYTGRPLLKSDRPATPPALQRNITAFSGRTGLSPTRKIRQPGIEGILQTTAKNIYAQGEKFGIGKVVRNAVDEVQKKAQEIRESQTPSPPPWRPSSVVRIRELEHRNKQMSELLASAVDELWEYQRSVVEAEDHVPDRTGAEKLCAAIAKVQYIQVCLEQPSLQLAESPLQVSKRRDGAYPAQPKPEHHDASSDAGESSVATPQHEGEGEHPNVASHLSEPSALRESSSLASDSSGPGGEAVEVSKKHDVPSIPEEPEPPRANTHQLRPSLEQGSFSFMLGQDKERPLSPPPSRPHSSLFGGQDSTPGRAAGSKAAAGSHDVMNDDDDDGEFDMGSLKRAKGDRK